MRNAIFYFSLLMVIDTQAQSAIQWEKSYGGSNWDLANAIRQTADGGFVAAGFSMSPDGDVGENQGGEDFWIIKTDDLGNLQWEHNFGGSGNDRAEDIRQTTDGGYISVGHSQSADGDVGGNKGLRDYWIIKLDAGGNLQWERNYGGSGQDAANAVQQTADGGYIVAGSSESIDGDISGNKGGSDYWLLKLDADGNIQWKRNYGGSALDNAVAIEQTTDGTYIVAGYTSSNNGDVGGNLGSYDYWIVKLDESGNIQWEQNYGGSNADLANGILQTSEGGYVVVGESFSSDGDVSENNGINDAWILKLDASGAIQWGSVEGGFSYDEAESIQQTSDGGYIAGGFTRTPEGNTGGTAIDNAWILRFDASGQLLREERYGGIGIEQALSILQTTDNGYVFCGISELPTGDVSVNNGLLDAWIVKLSPLPGNIQGYVYLDDNDNCIFDAGDSPMAGIIVMAEDTATGNILYGYTNPQGHFLIETDTIPYLLYYSFPSPYYDAEPCSPNGQPVNLSGSNPNGNADFYVQPIIACPYMTVEIASPVLRRCFESSYYLSYCNNGTIAADDAYVEVSFPPETVVVASSIPWITVNGNTYTFPLGDVGALTCDQFSVTVSVDCDSTFIGQTLCAEAHIYPDSFCLPLANWNGAELKATAACIGTDSVELKVQNIGTGDMPEAVPFLVIEDIIMLDGGQIQLDAQQSAVWRVPVQGLTQRITAQQPADHPFKTFTTAAVTLCKTEDLPPVPGPVDDFVTAYADDEEPPFIAVDCQQIAGAYDPNEKTVHPRGAGDQGFITASTELTYRVNFQNTGNDTAFTVVITDSIAAYLDPATLRMGAASHPYILDIYGQGILRFTFQNIMLPDSAVSEPASHGFVQFSIRQKEGNATGTTIRNEANIYFDYNPPVITNNVLNTVGKIYIDGQVVTNDPDGQRIEVLAYPNPASDVMTFEVKELPGGFDLLLFDAQGRMVQQISTTGDTTLLYRNSMPEGLYFFEITSGGRSFANGRLIFK